MGLTKSKRLPAPHERDRDGKPIYRPTYAVWEVTLRCDQCCHFCGTRAGHARRDELNTDEALDVVRQLAQMGCREVALHGGEVYLRSDWLEIVRAIRAHGMDCTMVTGGKTMTRAQARQAAEAGITAVSVSIDGLEATHDELRGCAGEPCCSERCPDEFAGSWRAGWLQHAAEPAKTSGSCERWWRRYRRGLCMDGRCS